MKDALKARLAELKAIGPEDLRRRWCQLFRRPPPRQASAEFLRRAIAFRMQAARFGGIPQITRRRLAQLAVMYGNGKHVTAQPVHLRAGTRLIREWKGESYEVCVLEYGFICRGERYDSLSQIARKITGTRWSGPLFFGLRRERIEGPDDGE